MCLTGDRAAGCRRPGRGAAREQALGGGAPRGLAWGVEICKSIEGSGSRWRIENEGEGLLAAQVRIGLRRQPGVAAGSEPSRVSRSSGVARLDMIAVQRETTMFPSLLPVRTSGQPVARVIRALIVDDSPRFRVELRGLLELEDIQVVGEAGNGWEALALTESLNPDIILMDQNMPALSGIDATRRIKQAKPDRRVLFIAAEEAWRQEALRAGAEGYFVKGEGFEKLIQAIHQPGLGGALQWQLESRRHRRTLVRRVALTLGGLAVFALILVVFPLPSEWFPAIALIMASFSLVLYLIGGD